MQEIKFQAPDFPHICYAQVNWIKCCKKNQIPIGQIQFIQRTSLFFSILCVLITFYLTIYEKKIIWINCKRYLSFIILAALGFRKFYSIFYIDWFDYNLCKVIKSDT
jgi:hypothetical protein